MSEIQNCPLSKHVWGRKSVDIMYFRTIPFSLIRDSSKTKNAVSLFKNITKCLAPSSQRHTTDECQLILEPQGAEENGQQPL